MARRDLTAAAEFGARVRQRRVALGLSQMGLAEACGLHFTYVSAIERGRRNITLPVILQLASGLGIDAGELLAGMRPPKR